jgi:chemotaxis protein histidine kinase CheA
MNFDLTPKKSDTQAEAKEPEAKEPEAKEPEAKEPEAKEPQDPPHFNIKEYIKVAADEIDKLTSMSRDNIESLLAVGAERTEAFVKNFTGTDEFEKGLQHLQAQLHNDAVQVKLNLSAAQARAIRNVIGVLLRAVRVYFVPST